MNANKYREYTGQQLVDAVQEFALEAAKSGVMSMSTLDFTLLLIEIDSRLYRYETGKPLGSG